VRSVEATPTKEEPMTVEKQEAVKSDIESQLLPVTEKTEVKAIETPSDKMVIKSEAKVEQPKVEPAKVEVKPTEIKDIPSYGNIDKNTDIGGGVFTDKTKISSNLDAKELSPKEILDEELLTKGWYKIELNRNVSSRYPDPPNVDAKKTIESENVGVFKPIKIGEENYYTNYDKDSKKWYLYKEGSSDNEWKELKNGAIKSMLNSKLLNNNGEPIKEQIDYTEKDANEIELAKKKLAYNKYLQYLVNNFDGLNEKEQQQVRDIMQQSDSDKYYRWISQNVDDPKVIDFWIKALEKTNTDSYYLEEIKKKKNNLIPTEEPKVEVKEVPAVSDKMVIKSEAKVEPKPVEEAKMEVKPTEVAKGVPSYDDLGINTEKDPGAFLDATFDKNTKFEKMSPSELIEKDIFAGRGSNIKLERNKSLRYPDPPGTVFQKEKVGDKEYYSSYDKTNNKWYIYDENSSKDNWTEVKKGPIETLLNSKFIQGGNKIVESKVDYNSEEETEKMRKIKEGILLNKYLPYVMKNYDNLNETEKKKLKEDFRSYNILARKYIDSNDPNLDFWLDVNDKLFNNQATSSNAISFIQNDHDTYPPKLIRISNLNADIKKENVKVLKSVAGDIFYDNKNDLYYYGESFDRKDLKTEMGQYGTSDGKGGIIYEERPYETYFKVIPKGTPAYDKIKSSLSKYNK
jgi:hypothetical protein